MNRAKSRQYKSDEVDRIIRRALQLKRDEMISHDDLVDMAKELGLDSQTLETAIEQEQQAFDYLKTRKVRIIRRKAKFHRHLWSYIIVMGALILINIFTPGPWWFQWPVLGWGIGLALHFRAAYFPAEVELDSENPYP
ncbi:2TM domain-containing protein [Thermodesulfobacteriota bacterium]